MVPVVSGEKNDISGNLSLPFYFKSRQLEAEPGVAGESHKDRLATLLHLSSLTPFKVELNVKEISH